jgi:hypothetical protein
MQSKDIEKVIDWIWQGVEADPSLQIFAILDAARDTRIHSKLFDAKVPATSLFRGEKARAMATAAPYIVALRREDSFTQWLFDYGWGNSWGIFLEWAHDPDLLKRHCRSIFMVYDEEGKPLYFRYYDPRVMRVHLPTCPREDLGRLFGPVKAYYVEGDEPDILIHYALSDGQLVERKIPIVH